MDRLGIRMIVILLALSLTACNFGLPGARPAQPCSVTTSQQAANQLIQKLRSQSARSGATFSITATSDEVSSLIVQELELYKQQHPGNFIPLEHPVVCFTGGKLNVSGTVRLDQNNALDAQFIVNPALNNGKAAFKIEHVQVSGFPVPQEFSDQIAALINNTLNDNMDRVTLTGITVQEGQMTLTGRVQS